MKTKHIERAINDGAQMIVKQRMRGKSIFHATLTWPDGEGYSGGIATTIEGAIDNLDTRAEAEARST